MAAPDLLHTFLHTYCANDLLPVTFLPSILSALSSCDDIDSSPNLIKWISRINSLIHASDPGVRWAGLCLALKTSTMSKSTLLSCAQGWVSVVLPCLSKLETILVYKASVRLLYHVFCSSTIMPEFQRQVATPNVAKFTVALISLVEKQSDQELRVLCMDVLSVMVQIFPNLHRPHASQLSVLSLNFLRGSAISPSSSFITKSACRLHACLHVTGGKVGGSALWRKSLDETVVFTSNTLSALQRGPANAETAHDDPTAFCTLHMDRLQCGVQLLGSLMSAPISRSVLVPVQSLAALCLDLLKNYTPSSITSSLDPSFLSLLISLYPQVLRQGCQLLTSLFECAGDCLTPEFTRLFLSIAGHLEISSPIQHRLPLLELLPVALDSCCHLGDPLLAGRLLKALLPQLVKLLNQKAMESTSQHTNIGKKAKKRVQGYEGDDVFKTGRGFLCESSDEGVAILHALDALPCLLSTPDLPAYLQSLTSRILVSLIIVLPTIPPSNIASDVTLHDKILSRVKAITLVASFASRSTLGTSLPLVITSVGAQEGQIIDLMLHPRMPPLLRSLPQVADVALTSAEESIEEGKTRQALGFMDSREHVGSFQKETRTKVPENMQTDEHVIRTSNNVHNNTSDVIPTHRSPHDSMFFQIVDEEQKALEGSKPDAEVMEVAVSCAEEVVAPLPIDVRLSHPEQVPKTANRDSPVWGQHSKSTTTVSIQREDTMMVDEGDDGDGDIIIPPVNLDSDSDSEE